MVGSCSKAIKMLLIIIVWNYRDGEQISYCSGLETVVDFPGGTVVKNLPTSAGDPRDMLSIHGSDRSPGGGNGNPLQCSCLENTMDRGAWWAAAYGVAQSRIPRIMFPEQLRSARGWDGAWLLLAAACMLLREVGVPSIFSSISVFSNKSVLHIRWPKNWSFSFTSGGRRKAVRDRLALQ